MADLTAALARLEQLARAVPADACDPETILRLVRVARAAQEIQRIRALPLRMPDGSHLVARVRHAEYAEEKHAAWDALRAALEELNTASGPAQGLEVTQR